MSEYFQQMMRTDRSFIGLHYGKNHERVSAFCRALRDDKETNPDAVSVSIRWDDRRGYWVIASSRKEIVALVIDWFKQSELEFFTERLERASVQPMMILEGKSESELEEIRARRRDGVEHRVQGEHHGRDDRPRHDRPRDDRSRDDRPRDDRPRDDRPRDDRPSDYHQPRQQSSHNTGFQRPKRNTK